LLWLTLVPQPDILVKLSGWSLYHYGYKNQLVMTSFYQYGFGKPDI